MLDFSPTVSHPASLKVFSVLHCQKQPVRFEIFGIGGFQVDISFIGEAKLPLNVSNKAALFPSQSRLGFHPTVLLRPLNFCFFSDCAYAYSLISCSEGSNSFVEATTMYCALLPFFCRFSGYDTFYDVSHLVF